MSSNSKLDPLSNLIGDVVGSARDSLIDQAWFGRTPEPWDDYSMDAYRSDMDRDHSANVREELDRYNDRQAPEPEMDIDR